MTGDDDQLMTYPRSSVVGVVDDADEIDAIVRDLEGAAWDLGDVNVLAGEAAVHTFDPRGEEHEGLKARIVRGVQTLFGEEQHQFTRYAEAAEGGAIVVTVGVPDDDADQAAAVGQLLIEHGARDVRHFGRYEVTELTAR